MHGGIILCLRYTQDVCSYRSLPGGTAAGLPARLESKNIAERERLFLKLTDTKDQLVR